MRIFHTSDWHLGQSFHQYSRDYEHDAFLLWLCEQIKREQPDVLCISGDIFDTANPSIQAQKRLYQFLVEVHSQVPKVKMIFTAGNHDSGARIEMPATLLGHINCHVVGHVTWHNDQLDTSSLIVPIKNTNPTSSLYNQTIGFVVALPFLRASEMVPMGQPYNDQLAIPNILANLTIELERLQSVLPTPVPVVLMAHGLMRGGQLSPESEKNISKRSVVVGDSDAWPVHWFGKQWDYIALGHLHLGQTVGQQERIQYSGSPIPLSLSEINYSHHILKVDLLHAEPPIIEALPIPRTVPMYRLEQPKEVELSEWLVDQLSHFEFPECSNARARAWVEVIINTNAPPPPDFRMQCEHILPKDRVRLLRVIQGKQLKKRLSLNVDMLPSALESGEIPTAQDLFKQEWYKQYEVLDPSIMNDFMDLVESSYGRVD